MGGRVWTLTQTEDTLWYHVYKNQDGWKKGSDRKRRAGVSLQMENKSEKRLKAALKEEEEQVAVTAVRDTKEEEEMLRDYFQLNIKLGDLYKEWGAADPHFKRIADIFTGVCVCVCARMLLILNHLVMTVPKFVLLSSQVYECYVRIPLNACFPSFAPPTTTSLVSRAWWRGCARPWVPHCVNWIKPLTTIFLPCLRLQVLRPYV